MAIVLDQLISPAVLQLPFRDKTSVPLAGGVVTFYQLDQVTLKNVYYQSGGPGPVTYIAAPNPMTLTAAGTPADVNGNDILLFYYPYNESNSLLSQPYYITVYNSVGTLQFTRYNFPFGGGGFSPMPGDSFNNYILNNRFWRNIGSLSAGTLTNTWTTQYNSTGTYYYATVCPGQHDGFSMPDINYIKNANGSCTETITFTVFPEGSNPPLTGDVGPEYFINHTCTADTSGSSLKVYQFPIALRLATLVGQPYSFTIQAQSVSGTATIFPALYQFAGTGAASNAPQQLTASGLSIGTGWNKYVINGQSFPGDTGLTLGTGGDDAYYLQIGMPTGSSAGICSINFTLPSIYLGDVGPTFSSNSFATYDQIDSVINTPRTGDVRTSLNSFYPFGWVPMNDGTLGNGSSNATARANTDTWPLFALIWNAFSALSVNSASLVPIYTSAGSLSTYGASAYADWTANKAIALTQMMGKVILGTVPFSALLQPTYYETFTASSNVCTVGTAVNFYNGLPIYLQGGSLPSGLTQNTIYYVAQFNGSTTFSLSTTFANALSATIITFGSGSGAAVYSLAGCSEGEYGHSQSIAELSAHTHTVTNAITGSPSLGSGGTSGVGVVTTSSAGSGVPANVTQPGTYMNIYIKL